VYSDDLPGMLTLDEKKLINTRLFNTAEIRTLEMEENNVDLVIDLNERWYTFPVPIFELSDRNFNEWWQTYNHDLRRINFGLRLFQFNMRGRNETLRLVAQFGFQKRFEVSYRIPYIDRKQKQGLGFDFDFSETKNLPYQTEDHKLVFLKAPNVLRTMRGGAITYTYRNSFYDFHSLKLEFRSTSITDTIASLNPHFIAPGEKSQRYGALSYQFTSDHRDYVGYPLHGYYLNTALIRTGLTAADDVSKVEVTVNYSKFLDLNKGFFLSNNIVGYWSSPERLSYSAYGALGYRKQFVRGYEIYVIEGPQYFLNKTTFKKRIFSRVYHWKAMPIPQFRHIPFAIYLKTYADLGYVNNYPRYDLEQVNTTLTNKLLTGAGLGIDIVGSYDTALRIEYSFNGLGERGLFIHIKREF
jgi:outer membrane protein assembly factor BamA